MSLPKMASVRETDKRIADMSAWLDR
jgi:hypothetical protein